MTPPQLSPEALSAADHLISLGLREDLNQIGDLTSRALIPPDLKGVVQIVSRQEGVLAGVEIAERVFTQINKHCRLNRLCTDGARLAPGMVVAEAHGPVAALLTAERTALNFLTHLSGIASLTRRFVDAAAGSKAKILDTRKTIPGWRLLAKYAVACGGGTNHRMGLYDGVLIKDNHLGAWTSGTEAAPISAAVRHARKVSPSGVSIEVEVDSLEQLTDALQGDPDIVLLDNMSCDEMRQAVALRDRSAPSMQLEASGGITMATIGDIARTGVDRISIGALTHSAPTLDLGFDWIRRG
jgi:nicotinate-nucleotide pyrophosphorylase (carboxylating)